MATHNCTPDSQAAEGDTRVREGCAGRTQASRKDGGIAVAFEDVDVHVDAHLGEEVEADGGEEEVGEDCCVAHGLGVLESARLLGWKGHDDEVRAGRNT